MSLNACLSSIFFGYLLIFFPWANASVYVGGVAPDFSLSDEIGKMHTLSDFFRDGKKVALIFYPKDESFYCTKELCGIRDDYEVLTKKSIVALGVSYDTQKAHDKFKVKHNLPFPLLTDSKKVVAKLYGAQGQWYTFGFFPQRITFLIDETGIIVSIIRSVDSNNHVQQILDGFSR